MKTGANINKVINSYIIENFSISGTINSDKAISQPPYRPVHGLLFILILSGEAVVHTNDKQLKVGRRTLISIAPFQSYHFSDQSSDLSYKLLGFNLDFMADFPLMLKPYVAERMERMPSILLDRVSFKQLSEHHNNISEQYAKLQHPSRINIIKALLYVFVAEVNYIYSQQPVHLSGTHQEQVTDDFLKLLHAFYRKERKPEFYAEKLCISPKHLTKILKQVTGITLYGWICEFVIKEAKILLHSKDLSVAQISDELNFPNSSYFARYFRRYTKLSPLEFRERQTLNLSHKTI